MNATKYAVTLLAVATTGSFLLIKSPLRDRFLTAYIPPAIGHSASPIISQQKSAKSVLPGIPGQNNPQKQALDKERGAIAFNNNKLTRGIVFRIQLVASKDQIPLDNAMFNGCGDVREYYEGGMYKYTAGEFKAPRQSNEMFRYLETKGFNDSFLVAFKDDKHIGVKDAMKMMGRY